MGDISIGFVNSLILETFVVASDNYESWRILGFDESRFGFAYPVDPESSDISELYVFASVEGNARKVG
jgi:hypothetical protein